MTEVTSAEIERRATELLVSLPPHIWDGASLPIPVEEIADSQLGLLVRDRDDIPCPPPGPDGEETSVSGLLLTRRREIWVNGSESRQWPGRRRFTVAHEIGHWLLHRNKQNDQVFCRSATVDPQEDQPKSYPPIESEANHFAAALLMPTPLIRMKYEEMRERGLEFDWLCDKFGASGAAMGRRLHRVIT